MKSKTLNDYYKEHLSNYRSWNQLSHAEEYICFKNNLGENISIDETAFSNGELYIDRFHVQMQMQEALQDLRVQYRWQAIEQENADIKKARSEKKKYVPQCFENGDTLRQLLVRSRYLLFKAPDKWTSSQKVRAEILFKQFDDIKQFYFLSLQLGQIYSHNYNKDVARGKLALWFNKIEEWNYPQFNSVIETFKNHYDRILNFFKDRLTNASAESFNAKLKSFRTTFRGVEDVKFYLYRVMMLYA